MLYKVEINNGLKIFFMFIFLFINTSCASIMYSFNKEQIDVQYQERNITTKKFLKRKIIDIDEYKIIQNQYTIFPETNFLSFFLELTPLGIFGPLVGYPRYDYQYDVLIKILPRNSYGLKFVYIYDEKKTKYKNSKFIYYNYYIMNTKNVSQMWTKVTRDNDNIILRLQYNGKYDKNKIMEELNNYDIKIFNPSKPKDYLSLGKYTDIIQSTNNIVSKIYIESKEVIDAERIKKLEDEEIERKEKIKKEAEEQKIIAEKQQQERKENIKQFLQNANCVQRETTRCPYCFMDGLIISLYMQPGNTRQNVVIMLCAKCGYCKEEGHGF